MLGHQPVSPWKIKSSSQPKKFQLAPSILLSCQVQHKFFTSLTRKELGTLYVCGSGDAGQLGTGKREKEVFPVQMTLMTERVKDVACGVYHTLILTGNFNEAVEL